MTDLEKKVDNIIDDIFLSCSEHEKAKEAVLKLIKEQEVIARDNENNYWLGVTATRTGYNGIKQYEFIERKKQLKQGG